MRPLTENRLPCPAGSTRRDEPRSRKHLPPVVILGGGTNALSIARSLGRCGVRVYAINLPHEPVRYCRYARWIPLPAGPDYAEVWRDYLLGRKAEHLRGSVLLAASDAGLTLIAEHRQTLAARFLLDDSNPVAQRAMLDKLATYRAAAAAGVPAPRFWAAGSADQIDAVRPELVYPLIVKPKVSYLFAERFGTKFVVVNDFKELHDAIGTLRAAGVEVLLMEKIPGPDDRLCSYYTYLDENGDPLFHFTKRIIRRYPVNMGPACYHITDRIPQLHDLGLRLFRHVGLRGLANVEFKWDDRDGQFKLIECNARFTAANCLVESAGFDLARFVYRRLVGLPQEPLIGYRSQVRLWYPLEDFKAYWALRRSGELTFARWIASILHRQTFPLFQWRDPLPSLVDNLNRLGRRIVGWDQTAQRAAGPP